MRTIQKGNLTSSTFDNMLQMALILLIIYIGKFASLYHTYGEKYVLASGQILVLSPSLDWERLLYTYSLTITMK